MEGSANDNSACRECGARHEKFDAHRGVFWVEPDLCSECDPFTAKVNDLRRSVLTDAATDASGALRDLIGFIEIPGVFDSRCPDPDGDRWFEFLEVVEGYVSVLRALLSLIKPHGGDELFAALVAFQDAQDDTDTPAEDAGGVRDGFPPTAG